jgi:hypothetical protein
VTVRMAGESQTSVKTSRRSGLVTRSEEQSRLAWHTQTTVIAFALREGAAIIVLGGVLLTGQQVGGFAVVGLALMAMILGWPRQSQLQRDP